MSAADFVSSLFCLFFLNRLLYLYLFKCKITTEAVDSTYSFGSEAVQAKHKPEGRLPRDPAYITNPTIAKRDQGGGMVCKLDLIQIQ